MTAAQLSNLAMATSVVLYVLAMVAHALEWSRSRALAPASIASADRQLAPAGVLAGSALAAAPAAAPAATAGSEADPPQTTPEEPAGDGAAGSQRLARLRVDQASRVGIAFMAVGFAVHLASVVARGVAADRAPWGNMYEFVTAASLIIVAGYLVAALRGGLRWLGVGVALIAAVLNGLAITVFYVPVAPLVPALKSVWFIIHILAALVAGAAFNVGGLAAIAYLLRHRAEARGPVTGLLARLPAIDQIDRVSYRAVAFSFPLWTFTIAAGAIWAQNAWGRYWGWDPKETFSLITWVVYAAYLHARATAGWTGVRAAWLAILGLALFWFNFIGINLLVSGLHSYAGI